MALSICDQMRLNVFKASQEENEAAIDRVAKAIDVAEWLKAIAKEMSL